MDFGDAGLMAGMVAVALGLVKVIERLIDAAVKKKNGSDNGSVRRQEADQNLVRLIEIGSNQLTVMRGIERGLQTMESSLSAIRIEQAHLQKTLDALHRRIDQVLGERK